MSTFAIIRHAETLWNHEKKIQGSKDLTLSRQGVRQAEKWAFKLESIFFDKILSSTMVRARQTSDIISRKTGLSIDFESDFREQDFGEWEGKTIAEIKSRHSDILKAQEAAGWAFCPPYGESRHQVLNRSLAGLVRAAQKNPGARFLVVTHNSVMKCLIYHGMGLDFDPEKKPVILPYNLHWLTLQARQDEHLNDFFQVEALNAVDLEKEIFNQDLTGKTPEKTQ